jgi:primary-amine oxidase
MTPTYLDDNTRTAPYLTRCWESHFLRSAILALVSMSSAYVLLKQDDAPVVERRRHGRRIAFGIGLLLSTFALYSLWYGFPVHLPSQHGESDTMLAPQAEESLLEQCAANVPLQANAPTPVNVWASLDVDEMTSILHWVSEPDRGFNLTVADKAGLSDNTVFHIEAFRPSKADALAYLADPVTDNLPKQYARVTIHHGGLEEPVVRDYLVGPLPVGDKTSIRQLTEIYHRDEIPFSARGFASFGEFNPILLRMMPQIADVTQVCGCSDF